VYVFGPESSISEYLVDLAAGIEAVRRLSRHGQGHDHIASPGTSAIGLHCHMTIRRERPERSPGRPPASMRSAAGRGRGLNCAFTVLRGDSERLPAMPAAAGHLLPPHIRRRHRHRSRHTCCEIARYRRELRSPTGRWKISGPAEHRLPSLRSATDESQKGADSESIDTSLPVVSGPYAAKSRTTRGHARKGLSIGAESAA
jgi:hypothetical protein